jgi:hypothetical protein
MEMTEKNSQKLYEYLTKITLGNDIILGQILISTPNRKTDLTFSTKNRSQQIKRIIKSKTLSPNVLTKVNYPRLTVIFY